MSKLEASLEQRFVTLCTEHGWKALKFETPTESGWMDRIVLGRRRGHMFWCELKRAGKPLERLQEQRAIEAKQRGFRVYKVDNETELQRMFQLECLHSTRLSAASNAVRTEPARRGAAAAARTR